MRGLLMLCRRRVGDESGHVGILMAMVLFVVLGMLMMTWNTANLSKEKMRLQNAADAAALGFCTWQARGLNTIQNINDEMYVALSMADKLLTVASGFEGAALAVEALARANIPFVSIVAWFASQALHIVAMVTGCMSGLLASRICPWILQPLGYFYAYGSTALGWWGAEQLAWKNRADPLGNVSLTFAGANMSLGLYALGLSLPARDTFLLPVKQDDVEGKKEPWCRNTPLSMVFKATTFVIYRKVHELFGTGKPWQFSPWVSARGDKKGVGVTPGPSVWIAHKYHTHIETLPLDEWRGKSDGAKKMPMFAIAAAQCITGDVVPHSKKPGEANVNQRVAGFGTGATAKLVPVSTVLGKTVGRIVFH